MKYLLPNGVAPRVMFFLGLALVPIALSVIPPMIGVGGALFAIGFAGLVREGKI